MCLVRPLDVFRLLSTCASTSIPLGNLLLFKTISALVFDTFYQLVYVFFGVRAFAPLLFHNVFSYHTVLFVFV
jgi:hypothetical protein